MTQLQPFIMIENLNEFFNHRAMNKTRFCKEAGISIQHLDRVLQGKKPLTDKFYQRICKNMVEYEKLIQEIKNK